MNLYDRVQDPTDPLFGYRFGHDIDFRLTYGADRWLGLGYWGGDTPLPIAPAQVSTRPPLSTGIALAKHLARTREPAGATTTIKYGDLTIRVKNKTGEIMVLRDQRYLTGHHIYGSTYLEGADNSELYMFAPNGQIFFIKSGGITEVDTSGVNLPGSPDGFIYPGVIGPNVVARSGDGSLFLEHYYHVYEAGIHNRSIYQRIFRLRGGVFNALTPVGDFSRTRYFNNGFATVSYPYALDEEAREEALVLVANQGQGGDGLVTARVTPVRLTVDSIIAESEISGPFSQVVGDFAVAHTTSQRVCLHVYRAWEAVSPGVARFPLIVTARGRISDEPTIYRLETSTTDAAGGPFLLEHPPQTTILGDNAAAVVVQSGSSFDLGGDWGVWVYYTPSVDGAQLQLVDKFIHSYIWGSTALGAGRVIVWAYTVPSFGQYKLESRVYNNGERIATRSWPQGDIGKSFFLREDGIATFVLHHYLPFVEDDPHYAYEEAVGFYKIDRAGELTHLADCGVHRSAHTNSSVVSAQLSATNIAHVAVAANSVYGSIEDYIVYLQIGDSVVGTRVAPPPGTEYHQHTGMLSLGTQAFVALSIGQSNYRTSPGQIIVDYTVWLQLVIRVGGVVITQQYGVWRHPDVFVNSLPNYGGEFLAPRTINLNSNVVLHTVDNSLVAIRAKTVTEVSDDPGFEYFTTEVIAGPFTDMVVVEPYVGLQRRRVELVQGRIYIWPDGFVDFGDEVFAQKGGSII